MAIYSEDIDNITQEKLIQAIGRVRTKKKKIKHLLSDLETINILHCFLNPPFQKKEKK